MSKRCLFERPKGSLIEAKSAMRLSCSEIYRNILLLVKNLYAPRGIFFNRGHHETPFWALQVRKWTNSSQVGRELYWSSWIFLDRQRHIADKVPYLPVCFRYILNKNPHSPRLHCVFGGGSNHVAPRPLGYRPRGLYSNDSLFWSRIYKYGI